MDALFVCEVDTWVQKLVFFFHFSTTDVFIYSLLCSCLGLCGYIIFFFKRVKPAMNKLTCEGKGI